MAVDKIVYVTPAEWYCGELSHAAKSQLKSVIKNVFVEEIWNLSTVFRATEGSSAHYALDYLAQNWAKTRENIKENLYLNFISSPKNTEEIINSTQEWKVVVVGIERKELRNILENLMANGYNVVDNHTIQTAWSSVYALSLDLRNPKHAKFFEIFHGVL